MFKSLLTAAAAISAAALIVPTEAQAYAFAAARSSSGNVFEWCTKGSLQAAKKCAEDACDNSGGSNCRIVTTCNDGKWSGVAEVTFAGDIRRHGSGCGFTTRAKVRSKIVTECKRVRNSIAPKAQRCDGTVISPTQVDTSPNDMKWKWSDGQLVAR